MADTLRWRRVEAGYYELVGTDWTIANMQGQSVLYSGLVLNPWHVRRGYRTVHECPTKADAQAWVTAAVRREERRTRG